MRIGHCFVRVIAAVAFVAVVFGDVALAQYGPPPPPPPRSSGGYGPPPAQQPNTGAGIRRDLRTRYGVGTQLGFAITDDNEEWLGGQVSMIKPLSLQWYFRVDIFYGFMEISKDQSYRLNGNYVDNYHDVEMDLFGTRLMLGYWLGDVLAFRFGGLVGLANGYTYTGYCGEDGRDGKAYGPSAALGFHGWNPAGGGAWEFALQADLMLGMPYPRCYRSSTDDYDVWTTGHAEPIVISAQGLYFF